MTAYNFHPALLLRTPVYSYRYYSEKNLADVLKQPFFKKAIYFSSEVFYNELEKVNFNIDQLDKKAIDTLKKYFNRMCFRPTPFGICSIFAPLQWGQNKTNIKLKNNDLRPHVQFSFAKSTAYTNQLLNNPTSPFSFKLNACMYKVGAGYRFIKSSQSNAQMEFLIDSLKTDRFLKRC